VTAPKSIKSKFPQNYVTKKILPFTKKNLEKKIIFSIILFLLYHPFIKENLTALTKGSRVATATKKNAWWKQRLFGFSW